MTRKIEIFVDGQWQEIEFHALKKGDEFRMFEPTGEPVLFRDKFTIFIAQSDACPQHDSWDVMIQPKEV